MKDVEGGEFSSALYRLAHSVLNSADADSSIETEHAVKLRSARRIAAWTSTALCPTGADSVLVAGAVNVGSRLARWALASAEAPIKAVF
jgi:hypothetical protein